MADLRASKSKAACSWGVLLGHKDGKGIREFETAGIPGFGGRGSGLPRPEIS